MRPIIVVQMKPEVLWNDLIIEEGKLDPLALWRVGDRLIAELLGPFTTVVVHRPARYFSMYCWILWYLNKQQFPNAKQFWLRFFEVEIVFLCAIQLHSKHCYDYFRGQIGSEAAQKIIGSAGGSSVDLKKSSKIKNGWEANYKQPMYSFRLIETDFGMASGVKLTNEGVEVAMAYHNSVQHSQYFKDHLSSKLVPLAVVRDLAMYSCPCLISAAETDALKGERKKIIEHVLRTRQPTDRIDEELLHILYSIDLITGCGLTLERNGLSFDKSRWRKILSAGVFAGQEYRAPDKYYDIFKKWEIYNLDSLFVYSLESGLKGFLEYLQTNNDQKVSVLNRSVRALYSDVTSQSQIDEAFVYHTDVHSTIRDIASLPKQKLLEMEETLVERIGKTSGSVRLIYAFLFYVYVQAQYWRRKDNAGHADALKWYHREATIDGSELSLLQADYEINKLKAGTMEDFFHTVFFTKWIWERQLMTRFNRGKEMAWFSYNRETDMCSWEADYDGTLYRAAREDILMTFLLNLDIVHRAKGGWLPNAESPFFS